MQKKSNENLLNPDSCIKVRKNVLSSNVAGEAVILNVNSNIYYGLDEVGAFLWNKLKKPGTIKDLLVFLADEYDVKPDECESDLYELLGNLLAADLIEVADA